MAVSRGNFQIEGERKVVIFAVQKIILCVKIEILKSAHRLFTPEVGVGALYAETDFQVSDQAVSRGHDRRLLIATALFGYGVRETELQFDVARRYCRVIDNERASGKKLARMTDGCAQ